MRGLEKDTRPVLGATHAIVASGDPVVTGTHNPALGMGGYVLVEKMDRDLNHGDTEDARKE